MYVPRAWSKDTLGTQKKREGLCSTHRNKFQTICILMNLKRHLGLHPLFIVWLYRKMQPYNEVITGGITGSGDNREENGASICSFNLQSLGRKISITLTIRCVCVCVEGEPGQQNPPEEIRGWPIILFKRCQGEAAESFILVLHHKRSWKSHSKTDNPL